MRVEIEGIEGAARRNVRAALSLARAVDDERPLTEGRIGQLHDQAPGEARRALEPFGYYAATVKAELQADGEDYRAVYRIDPGPPLRVAEVSIELLPPGRDEPALAAAARGFPLAPGDVLDQREYEQGKQAFLAAASDHGYLDATFRRSELRIDLDAYTSRIVLVFDSGPPYRFGPVTFRQDILEPSLLHTYVPFSRGERFDLDKLAQLQRSLGDSPYFQRAEVEPRREEARGLEVPIVVSLVPAKPTRWELGAGYGTDTGPRARVTLERRRIGRQGHRGGGDVILSGIERSVALRYEVPGSIARTDLWTYGAGYEDLSTDAHESTTWLASAGLVQERGEWRQALVLGFRHEDYEVGVDRGTADLLIPTASWTRVRADDRLFPGRGSKIETRVRGAAEALLSDASFAQLWARAKYFRTLTRNLRAHGRLELGYDFTDQFRELPATIRFFAGGDQSVRGFAYQSLGDRDVEGSVIGGKALVTGTLELDWLPIAGWGSRFGGAVFLDFGNAASSFPPSLERSAGAGLRWLSPIGLVRADYAFALTEPGRPGRFHLAIGPDL